jgi:hypothetical protein
LPDVEEEQRESWPARKRDALNSARTRAIRMLKRAGYQAERWPNLLVWVVEDQQRGLPHLHFVLGHTAALEKAFAKAFFSVDLTRDFRVATSLKPRLESLLGRASTHGYPAQQSRGLFRNVPRARVRSATSAKIRACV